MSKRSIKEQLAGYFSTYTKNKITGSDLIDQNEKDKWLKFYNAIDNNISTYNPVDKKTKLSEINDEKGGQQKLYEAAVKYNLFKNGDPKDQPVSQEVKASAIPPFIDDPDAPSSSGPPPMQEQQGEMSLTPLSQLPLEVYNSIVYSQDQKQQAGGLLSSMFKDKNIISKMKKAVKTGNKKTRERTAQQEQELKEARQKLVALANAERIAQAKQDMLERDVKARLDQQESFYKTRLKAEIESNQAKLDPKEVARQLEEYKTRFETEQRQRQQKDQDLINRLELEYKSTLEQEKKAKLDLEKKLQIEQKTNTDKLERLKKLSLQKLKEQEDKQAQKQQEQELKFLDVVRQLQIQTNLAEENARYIESKNIQPSLERDAAIDTIFQLADATQKQEEQLRKLEDRKDTENIALKLVNERKLKEQEELLTGQNRVNEAKAKKEIKNLQSSLASQAEELEGLREMKDITEEQQVEIKRLNSRSATISNMVQAGAIVGLSGLTGLLSTKGGGVDMLPAVTFAGLNYMANRGQENKQKPKPKQREVKRVNLDPDPDDEPPAGPPSGGGGDEKDEPQSNNNLLAGVLTGVGAVVVANKASESLSTFKQFFNGDFTVPGYNFLGPGTDIKERIASGLKPVDLLDKIAYEHDLLYSLARTPEQIREADQNMINAIDKYLKGDVLANMVKEIITQKMDYEKKSLFEFSNKILEENKQTTKQERNIYDQLLNEISYNQPASTPALEPPETVQDIKTTEPVITIETMPPKNEQVSGLEKKEEEETKAETKAEVKGTTRTSVKTRPVVYNPPPAIGPERSRVSGSGGPGRPYKTIADGKQVAPLRGAGFPDRAITDQSDYINEDEIKRGPGILKPKFIMPSVNILNRTEQEQYVDDLEFAMFDFVQDDSGGNDPNGTNPLLRDQNLSLGLRYQRAGVTINSLFGENLPDDPRNMSQKRVKELFLGESLIPEMKFLYSDQFEAQEFNLSEFEVDQYDVNNERTAVEMFSPYADFTDNQLLDQYIDTSILYGIVP